MKEKTFKFIAVHECVVDDQPHIQMITAKSIDEAHRIAFKHSYNTAGLSQGNYDLFVSTAEFDMADFDPTQMFTV